MKKVYDKSGTEIGEFESTGDIGNDYESHVDNEIQTALDLIMPVMTEKRIHSDSTTAPNFSVPGQAWEYIGRLTHDFPTLTPSKGNRGVAFYGENRSHNHGISSHNHQWSTGLIYQSVDSKNEEKAVIQVKSFNSSGGAYTSPYYGSGGSDGSNTFSAYTAKVNSSVHSSGGNYNKPAGIGTGFAYTYIYIRKS